MNKKGSADVAWKTIYWMLAGIVISSVVLFFAFFVAGYKNDIVAVPFELQAEMTALRFANIPECFAYQDLETERVYPGSIDLSKFNEEKLKKCYWPDPETGRREINFQLTLLKKELSIQTNKYSNVPEFTIFKDVSIWEDGEFKEDTLIIVVQRPIFG